MDVRNATGLGSTTMAYSPVPPVTKGYAAEVIEALAASLGVAPQTIAQALGCAEPHCGSQLALSSKKCAFCAAFTVS